MAAAGSDTARAAGEHGAYAHVEAMFADYVGLAVDDPHRQRLREQLVTELLPIARNIAARYKGRGEPIEDLIQVASLGLLKAIDRYRPELGHHFLGYAVPTITGEVRRYFRDHTWSMRVPRALKDHHVAINHHVVEELSTQLRRAPRPSEIAARLDMSTEQVLQALHAAQAYKPSSLDTILATEHPGGVSVGDLLGADDPGVERFINTHSLKPALVELPERERRIVIMRFYQDMTQSQIAEQIGVSQMHISRLLSTTLAHLRDWLTHDPAEQPHPPTAPEHTGQTVPSPRPRAHPVLAAGARGDYRPDPTVVGASRPSTVGGPARSSVAIAQR